MEVKNQDIKDNIIREASMMQNLRHRNIISFYGICVDTNYLSIITEFSVNGNLFDCLFEKKNIENVFFLLS